MWDYSQAARIVGCLAFADTGSGSPWHSLTDTQRVRPWMLDRPVHGADGRLAHHHGLPFEHQRNLLIQMTSVTMPRMATL
ncbi:hypothetical protein G3485_13735 [Shewanella baltica]|uniref:hypothetical protein n=1 Tax=Shewanella baltica TaxID=62322 RepID=UPI00217D1139|nr:hypothetical protein [Shewanella baltica]MCS6128045.1 hypothetical protein [Shewanella baltica]MCS6140088.1 hypothetical protein [Shewanella baltica]MCS6146229.1 hypothetical protein [Shewanella baltica]MCS6170789.1 hypothetical protein [Shewanella baltica]MCS6196746.1 hypothetical protein [Shewanella baltica]